MVSATYGGGLQGHVTLDFYVQVGARKAPLRLKGLAGRRCCTEGEIAGVRLGEKPESGVRSDGKQPASQLHGYRIRALLRAVQCERGGAPL